MSPRRLDASTVDTTTTPRAMRPLGVALVFALLACEGPTLPTAGRVVYPAHAAASVAVEKTIVTGIGGTANFVLLDGCIAADHQLTVAPVGSAGHEALLVVTVINTCAGGIIDNLGTLGSQVTFTGDLDQATLNGSIVVLNLHGDVLTVPVALTWTGVGPIAKGNTEITVQNDAGTRVIVRTKGSSRSATLTGTIDGRSVTRVFSASLFKALEGTITITR